jgi:HEAT repeat protein
LILLVTMTCAMKGPLPSSNADRACADSAALNQAVWSDNGITRRQALKALSVCGQEHWKLKVLMAPLTELDDYEHYEAWINIYTALDPQAIATPERITEFLLARADSTDPEERRLAIAGLDGRLGDRFSSISSFIKSQPALLRGLNDTDSRVRRTAAKAATVFVGHSFFDSPEGRAQLLTLLRPLVSALVSRTSDSAPEVRAASVMTLSTLATYAETDGFTQLLTTDQVLSQLEQMLSDPSAQVRLEAVKAMIKNGGDMDLMGLIKRGVSDEKSSPVQKETMQQRLLFLIQDQDLEVAMVAANNLDQTKLPDLVTLIRSGRLSTTTVTAVLSAALMNLPAGYSLLQDLLSSPDSSLRINAQRAINSSSFSRRSRIPNDQLVKSRSIFGQGLRSSDPATQIDAISGLSELGASSDSIALLRPTLSSPLPLVRWAGAIVISDFNPKDETIFNALREILETSSSADLRTKASNHLLRTHSPKAAKILGETAQKQSRYLLYVRSCSSYGVGFPEGQDHEGVNAMTRPACRRAVAESIGHNKRNEKDVVNALLRVSVSGDDDQRFNAIYALGSMVDRGSTITEQKLSDRITALLLPITSNQQEHPEVRRIAATMLHLRRQPMPEFFSSAGLPFPDTACANAFDGRERKAGFSFDPYEGRCMFNTQVGCGAGLSEVYSTLRRMLGHRKAL